MKEVSHWEFEFLHWNLVAHGDGGSGSENILINFADNVDISEMAPVKDSIKGWYLLKILARTSCDMFWLCTMTQRAVDSALPQSWPL